MKITFYQAKQISENIITLGLSVSEVDAKIQNFFGKTALNQLTEAEASKFIDWLEYQISKAENRKKQALSTFLKPFK